MSMKTDIVFYKALTASQDITDKVDDRIYNTSIPLPDENVDNVDLPYIIVTFDGLQNEGYTKDDCYEGPIDKVDISIEIAAKDRESLAELAELVRAQIPSFFENYEPEPEQEEDLTDLIPLDYTFTAGVVSYDAMKPCYWNVLHYHCDTNK